MKKSADPNEDEMFDYLHLDSTNLLEEPYHIADKNSSSEHSFLLRGRSDKDEDYENELANFLTTDYKEIKSKFCMPKDYIEQGGKKALNTIQLSDRSTLLKPSKPEINKETSESNWTDNSNRISSRNMKHLNILEIDYRSNSKELSAPLRMQNKFDAKVEQEWETAISVPHTQINVGGYSKTSPTSYTGLAKNSKGKKVNLNVTCKHQDSNGDIYGLDKLISDEHEEVKKPVDDDNQRLRQSSNSLNDWSNVKDSFGKRTFKPSIGF